jgi:hypothetical protein
MKEHRLDAFCTGGSSPPSSACDTASTATPDKIRHDVGFRKKVAEKAGLGFELPSKKPVVGPNGPKIENEVVLEIAASA